MIYAAIKWISYPDNPKILLIMVQTFLTVATAVLENCLLYFAIVYVINIAPTSGGNNQTTSPGKKVTFTGEGQVIRLSLPLHGKMSPKPSGLIKMQHVRLDILTEGDFFTLK